jgi:hypothetical protein
MHYLSTSDILEQALVSGLIEVYVSQPELFNLEKLGPEQKASLIQDSSKIFLEPIASLPLTAYDKFIILKNVKGASIAKRIKLTESELKKLSIGSYMELIKVRFDEYIRIDRYNEMSKIKQSELFLIRPDWIIETTGVAPPLTIDVLSIVARNHPDVIDKHYSTFYTTQRTDAYFWMRMFRYDGTKYEELFLQNTRSLKNKTEVRTVFRQHPNLIKQLTIDIVSDSALSGKEWVILINQIMKDEKRLFSKFKFSADLTEYFELDLTSSILKGKGSKQLQNATNNIISKVESQKNIEDTSPRTSEE